jgi:hypothetical protein
MRLRLYGTSARLLALAATLSSAVAWAQARTTAAPSAAAPEPATSAQAAPTSEIEECVPACRKGFTCVKGQCVSLCNPPCAANEVCTAAAECVAVAPAAAPQPKYAPAQAPNQFGAEQIDLATDPPARAVPREEQIKTFSFAPRLGVQLLGKGTAEGQCSGSLCAPPTSASDDYDLSSAVATSFDFLFKVGNLVRLGPGLMYTHTMDAQRSGASAHTELGNFTDLDFVVELIPRVSPTVWLIPRLQLGLMAYNASGTAEDGENASQSACNTNTGFSRTGCDSYKSPHIGFNAGLGFGVMFAAGSTVRVRIDALSEYYTFKLHETTATTSDGRTASMTASTSGERYLLLAGIEI